MDSLQYLFRLEKLGIKFGLDNIRRLCAALGSPHEAFRSVLIAGTNGKGSVVAMVERALRAAGLRAARYTSPHLVRLEERYFIDGAPVETETMREAADRVRRIVEQLIAEGELTAPPTFFEVTTAIAFELFRRRNVEVAVLEVGLGGRLDSTNVVTPIAAAITSIDLDHQALLGSTIREIAFEKAGIVRPDIPVVIGETKPEAVDVINRVCRDRNARLVHAWAGVQARTTLRTDGRLDLDLTTPLRSYGTVKLALRGRHQARNAVTAVRLLEQLQPFDVPDSAIVAGLTDVAWPGRLQLLAVGTGRAVLLDSAHNPAGAAAVARYLAETHQPRLPIVFAAMHDKDAEAMLVALRAQARAFVMSAPHTSRAASSEALAGLAARVAPGIPIYAASEPAAALARAWQLSPVVCVTGSIFLVGEVLDLLARDAV